MANDRLRFQADGAVRLPGVISGSLSEWTEATQSFFDLGKPGHRISTSPELARLAKRLTQDPAFIAMVDHGWDCVRAIAFNKTRDANWSLAWHQDRTIAVARREPLEDYSIWSTKDGIPHVEPPYALLERMVTLRLHLDPVNEDNAPLLIARGSHRLGKVDEARIDEAVAQSSILECHATAGDGWLYATPVLHASARSTGIRERRVIHLDFARDALPDPLEWAGVG